MSKIKIRGEIIRKFILDHVTRHAGDIGKFSAEHFGVSRQAINLHLQKLIAENALHQQGNTKNKIYKLAPILEWRRIYQITPQLAEDVIWRQDVLPVLGKLPENVQNIWQHGFTEMFNNALDHSGGTEIIIHIRKTAPYTEMLMSDDGVGIFKKIQTEFNLLDERHAILELSKGKLTTDPKRHSGEGIFFTSRMFDSYDILSGGVYFTHKFGQSEDWILERDKFQNGTNVWMKINNHTSRTTKKIFDQFAEADEFSFSKTIVPVRLAQYGQDKLISRSQAKRLLQRIEQFKVVIFDFTGVDSIGQAFADEIFRVSASQHSQIEFQFIHANAEVKQMIHRVKK